MSSRRKTKSCISMVKNGYCANNMKCKYAHKPNELDILPCKDGDNCSKIRIRKAKQTK